MRTSQLSNENLISTIDRIAGLVTESSARNIDAWRVSQPRRSSEYTNHKLDGTWTGEIETLKSWLLERVSFMDANFANPTAISINNQIITSENELTVLDDQQIGIVSAPEVLVHDRQLLNRSNATFFVVTGEENLDVWMKPEFDDASWDSGEYPVGFGNRYEQFINTTIDPISIDPEANQILMRIDFDASSLASDALF